MASENNHENTSVVENTMIETHEAVDSHGTPSDESITASLGLNAQLFVFQLINFAIVAGILWFLVLKPLTKKMEERKKMVDESIDNAKRVETNLQMSEQKFQEKVDEAKVEANKIIEKSHEEGKVLSDKLRQKAHEDIELLVQQAKKNIEIDKKEMREEIKKDTAEIIILALEKILGKKITEDVDKEFIEGILKQSK